MHKAIVYNGSVEITSFSYRKMVQILGIQNSLLKIKHFLCFFSSGLHQNNANCKPDEQICKIQTILENAEYLQQLYPNELKVTNNLLDDSPLGNGNGGWGDIRDHGLCLNFTYARIERKLNSI